VSRRTAQRQQDAARLSRKKTELGTNKAQLNLTARLNFELQASTFNISGHLLIQQPFFFGSLSFKPGRNKGAYYLPCRI
jgi:hypothetical protein